ncbi:MAG: hypothetical protein EHM80_03430 [Nitrospiraceae bacterium]|nr:MAG: hypothetical protein EHM80_03430 [Nitrospiraceae bacterium]
MSRKQKGFLGAILFLLWSFFLCGQMASGALFTVDGAFDYESATLALSWWPDPNGGLGLMAVTDSVIEDDTWSNIAVGPVVTFQLTKPLLAVLKTILPMVDVPNDVPAQLYGRFAGTWPLDRNEEGGHRATFYASTGVLLTEHRIIQPALWATYEKQEGEQQELRMMAGVVVWLGK